MFSFFRKSKRDDGGSGRKNKDKDASVRDRNLKESGDCPADDKRKMCKNNQPSTPELALDIDAIPLPKNIVNAAKTISCEAATFYEKNNEPTDTKMSEPTLINGLRVPENKVVERRGSNVKPCGHGTTAIAPRIPVQGTVKKDVSTPPASPVMEVRKTLKFTVNDIQEHIKEEPLEELPEKKDKIPGTETVPVSDSFGTDEKIQHDKKNLINQEAKFQSQLNDLSKQLTTRDAEATKLRFQMEELQRDVFAKAAGMDRLQTELNAATKEVELIRQKIHHLENELECYRKRNNELVDEIDQQKGAYSNYEQETQSKISELEGVIGNLRARIQTLEDQINELKEEKSQLEVRHAELQTERDEERKKLAETLEATAKQKEEIERKWKEDFEKLRTVNILKEQELLDDFEWKLREVQQLCKKKLDDKDKTIDEKIQDAYKDAQKKMKEAENVLQQVEILKSYEIEVQQLRGRTSEQEKTLQQMKDQQAQMIEAEASLKNETKRLLNLIALEKENLQHMQRLHRQELLDKERQLKNTLNQKRIEVAMYWEEKLLHECSRLKEELEQIHDEEKYVAMETVRKEKEEEFRKRQNEWEKKLKECLKEIEHLKKALDEKDEYYHDELISVRTKTDRDIMELRRLMDKIDMTHHDNYDKLVEQHEHEIEKLNHEHELKIKELEETWKNKVFDVSANLEEVKRQMEQDSEEKIETLIQQHRDELDSQWQNLIHQKEEAARLLEEEYITKYKTLEEQFYSQKNSHGSREVELLKTIDALKNELQSKESTLEDLQSNVDTLEGGVQVLNQEIAQQTDYMGKVRNEAEQKIRSLHETLAQLLEEREKEREAFRIKFMGSQKQSQETIEHLQRKCTCLTKLFEEVRQRYERRESRQEDLNIISDLKQVIAEQEKDLACINEEKRYFQMRLMQLERHLEQQQSSVDEEDYEDAESSRIDSNQDGATASNPQYSIQPRPFFLPPNPNDPNFMPSSQNGPIFIPPTIPEAEE
ncbi:hypothetical protein GWI33_010669 [Rhynchophorus ferrugineus]|uniref:Protein FAM184A/B N-terminal domain-containing protein n=1 Tax=Rhynchophorus ferrugineus TaxID=354439 RepID=A0A834MM72_RHYFE|nr:hypothetical protein GWI33_010669 [Rhynchophorus ferrugineus]